MVEDREASKDIQVKRSKSLRIAGTLVMSFAIQFAIVMIIAESLYPGYSVANNYISDLGVGKTGSLFDTSIVLLGAAVIASAYFLNVGFGSKVLAILVGLAGTGALLVGVFNESFGTIHSIVSDWTFLAGSTTAIYAFRVEEGMMRYASVILGLFSLAAIFLFVGVPGNLGLGVGGMERMIVYPFLMWGIAFGGYLMGFGESANH